MAVSQGSDNYPALHAGLRWQVPPDFNIAQVCCRRWAAQEALVAIRAHGTGRTLTYVQLQQEANRMANLLVALGVHTRLQAVIAARKAGLIEL